MGQQIAVVAHEHHSCGDLPGFSSCHSRDYFRDRKIIDQKPLLMLSSPGQKQMCTCPSGSWPTENRCLKLMTSVFIEHVLTLVVLLHVRRVRNAPTLHPMKTDPILFEGLMYRTKSVQKQKRLIGQLPKLSFMLENIVAWQTSSSLELISSQSLQETLEEQGWELIVFLFSSPSTYFSHSYHVFLEICDPHPHLNKRGNKLKTVRVGLGQLWLSSAVKGQVTGC